MATIDDCLRNQRQNGILAAPTDTSASANSSTSQTKNSAFTPAVATAASASTGTPATLQIALQNNTTAANLYAYVTGLDLNNNNAVWMLQSDGVTAYYPANPSANQQPLQANVSIVVGGPGSVRKVTIPQLAGARIWFSQDSPLTFLLNIGANGPGLVEPSVTNPADPNYPLRWDFCEFTYNTTEMFANISYVDFVSIPVALELTSTDGSATQTVAGLPSNGLSTICEALQAQQLVDCAGWDQLVVQITSATAGTSFLRALSPYCGMIMNSSLFANYFDPYVAQVWSKYLSTAVTIDTQASWGTVSGQVDSSANLTFAGVGSFPKPTTGDIFSCSTGAFAAYATNTDEMANIGARLAAALNRSTLLAYSSQPDGTTSASDYYQTTITNHYARIVHAANLDGRGYAFPYDDVAPDGGADQSGAVASGAPALLTVYIGGGGASGAAAAAKARSNPIRLRDMARRGRQLVGGRQHFRRSLPSPPPSSDEEEAALAMRETMSPFLNMAAVDVDEKALLQARDRAMAGTESVDLEKGQMVMTKVDTAAPLAPTTPDLSARFALLLHQALLSLWVAICGLGRSAWALVPRRVAAPVGAFCNRVAASPAVTAASASISSFVSSVVKSAAASAVAAMLIRPLVIRAVLTGAVLLVTYAATAGGSAGASPMLASAVATMTGWVEELTGTQPAAALVE
ncbi:hypothetical protein SBRCBS47491_007928 [Sporothrix bragantina]|uniref:GH64 domain-containing protein n=1 Tax=Sporothrix bragantina TaxID=671064 RepID=A0ABP0CH76_9PEZI